MAVSRLQISGRASGMSVARSLTLEILFLIGVTSAGVLLKLFSIPIDDDLSNMLLKVAKHSLTQKWLGEDLFPSFLSLYLYLISQQIWRVFKYYI